MIRKNIVQEKIENQKRGGAFLDRRTAVAKKLRILRENSNF